METTGNQRQILMLHQERPVRAEHDVVLSAPLMTDAMHHAVLKSGREFQDVAASLGLSKSQFSKALAANGKFTFNDLPEFMRQTGSIAPLQWLADRMGYLLEAKPAMTRIAQLEAELAAERAKVAA